jgi:hypothetical protein
MAAKDNPNPTNHARAIANSGAAVNPTDCTKEIKKGNGKLKISHIIGKLT